MCYRKQQNDFADVVELRILSWRNHPGLSGQDPYKREVGYSDWGGGEEFAGAVLLVWEMEKGPVSQGVQAASRR